MRWTGKALLAALVCCVVATGCDDSTDVKCGAGTIRDGGQCVIDGAGGGDGAAGGQTAGQAAQTRPEVAEASVTRLEVSPTVGTAPRVGYPMKIDLDLQVRGEPFRTDIYIGLETDKGERCILGLEAIEHQSKAFELAEAARVAKLTTGFSYPAASSRSDCSEGMPACAKGEMCVGFDAAGAPIPMVDGEVKQPTFKDPSKPTADELAHADRYAQHQAAQQTKRRSCTNSTDFLGLVDFQRDQALHHGALRDQPADRR